MKKLRLSQRKFISIYAAVIAVVVSFSIIGCKSSHQLVQFEGFKIEEGIYKADPGWHFVPQDDGTYTVMKADDDISGSGGRIEPCDCALTAGGNCAQVTIHDDDTDEITEIWCISEGCGFCVGGTTVVDQDGSLSKVKVRLEKVRRKVANE